MSLLVLSSAAVRRVSASLKPADVERLMAEVFFALSGSAGTCSSPLRTAISMKQHKTLFMPARLDSIGTAIKVVSVPTLPGDQRGLPATTLVLDENTGAVKAIVNARSLTALRNAGGSLLSTTLIGPKAPSHIVVFGAGNQIQAHLELHLRAFTSIHFCTVVNRHGNDRLAALLVSLKQQFSHVTFKSIISSAEAEEGRIEVKDALSTADIIVCATSSNRPLFPSSWVRSGTHIILIGSYTKDMREVDDALVRRALSGQLLVESRSAAIAEAGELISAGVIPEDVVELGELVNRTGFLSDQYTSVPRVLGENDFSGVTLFKSVGIGIQDVAIASMVVERAHVMLAKGEKLGTSIEDYDVYM
ncbi:hypothetical protein C8J56DRAFT_955029 [Mycena floridula]|nr:hypothetical protein C8J56DRAFT_955029 [Mycena floridula]